MARRRFRKPTPAAPLGAEAKLYMSGYKAAVAGEPPDVLRHPVSAQYAAGYEHGREDRHLPVLELRNDPPRPKRVRFESKTTRQAVLFTGLKCLAGQEDLFDDV